MKGFGCVRSDGGVVGVVMRGWGILLCVGSGDSMAGWRNVGSVRLRGGLRVAVFRMCEGWTLAGGDPGGAAGRGDTKAV